MGLSFFSGCLRMGECPPLSSCAQSRKVFIPTLAPNEVMNTTEFLRFDIADGFILKVRFRSRLPPAILDRSNIVFVGHCPQIPCLRMSASFNVAYSSQDPSSHEWCMVRSDYFACMKRQIPNGPQPSPPLGNRFSVANEMC